MVIKICILFSSKNGQNFLVDLIFSCCRFAYDTFPIYHANVLAASATFWPW